MTCTYFVVFVVWYMDGSLELTGKCPRSLTLHMVSHSTDRRSSSLTSEGSIQPHGRRSFSTSSMNAYWNRVIPRTGELAQVT